MLLSKVLKGEQSCCFCGCILFCFCWGLAVVVVVVVLFFRNLSDFGIFTRNGLLSNSLLFFSSDNGGAGAKNNRPLRGKKEQVVDQ